MSKTAMFFAKINHSHQSKQLPVQMSQIQDKETTSLLDKKDGSKTKKRKFIEIPKAPSLSQIWWLTKLALSQWCLVMVGSVFLVLGTGTGLILPNIIGRLVDQILTTQDGKKWLMQLSLGLAGLFLFQAIANWIRSFCFQMAGERIVADLRRDLFAAILDQDIEFFDMNKTGELTNRLSSDTKVLENTVSVNISMASRYIIQAVGGVGFLFWISWKLTLIMLAIIPVLAISAVFFGKWVKNLGKVYQDALAASSSVAEESLSNVRTVRSFGQEARQKREYNHQITESYSIALKLAVANSSFGSLMMMCANISMIGVLWYGGTLVLDKELTIGTLTSFIVKSTQSHHRYTLYS